MFKRYIIPIILLAISGFCFLRYNIIGSYVAPDGMLVEPFYLVGIGSFAFLASVLSGAFITVKNFIFK